MSDGVNEMRVGDESDLSELARILVAGGCENRVIATAVSQCARTIAARRATHPRQIEDLRQTLVDAVRRQGWFE